MGQILLSFFSCSYLQLLKKDFKKYINNCQLWGVTLVPTKVEEEKVSPEY